MKCCKWPLVLTVVALAFSGFGGPRAQGQKSHGKPRMVPPERVPGPFLPDGEKHLIERSNRFLPAGEMKQSDRLLAADAETSVAEHARWYGFVLGDGSWSYQQVVCPALPGHLFLQYTRNNGVGDVTVFSASIPRNGEGRVRIIPILKRSYSLFSPAPINSITISAFNHIRAEEPGDTASGWLGNGLCYAALAGAHPMLLPETAEPTLHNPIPAVTPVLVISGHGTEVIEFADAAARPRPMQWIMTFDKKGKLVKAAHSVAPESAVHPVPHKSAVEKTWTLSEAPKR